ncbi:hypothetical protein SDC9_156620 [bioreactor metagenome]|uniref:Uncharacterized protein n=1 Tax=bioreactor metagenome TaxID=1076179 RepID=A0A645F4Y0_9ZZZZ
MGRYRHHHGHRGLKCGFRHDTGKQGGTLSGCFAKNECASGQGASRRRSHYDSLQRSGLGGCRNLGDGRLNPGGSASDRKRELKDPGVGPYRRIGAGGEEYGGINQRSALGGSDQYGIFRQSGSLWPGPGHRGGHRHEDPGRTDCRDDAKRGRYRDAFEKTPWYAGKSNGPCRIGHMRRYLFSRHAL